MTHIDLFVSPEVSKEITFDDANLITLIGKQVKNLLLENDYGDAVKEVAIIPTIFSEGTYKVLAYKERKIYSPKKKEAEFRLKIDFEKFVRGNDAEKKKMILDNFIESITILSEKVRKDFDGKRLIRDIKKLFNL
jgi:hypothetical protein